MATTNSRRADEPRVRNLPASLASLRPAVVGFGHGPPLRGQGLIDEALSSLVSS